MFFLFLPFSFSFSLLSQPRRVSAASSWFDFLAMPVLPSDQQYLIGSPCDTLEGRVRELHLFVLSRATLYIRNVFEWPWWMTDVSRQLRITTNPLSWGMSHAFPKSPLTILTFFPCYLFSCFDVGKRNDISLFIRRYISTSLCWIRSASRNTYNQSVRQVNSGARSPSPMNKRSK